MSPNFRDKAQEAGIPAIPAQCGEYISLDLVNIVQEKSRMFSPCPSPIRDTLGGHHEWTEGTIVTICPSSCCRKYHVLTIPTDQISPLITEAWKEISQLPDIPKHS